PPRGPGSPQRWRLGPQPTSWGETGSWYGSRAGRVNYQPEGQQLAQGLAQVRFGLLGRDLRERLPHALEQAGHAVPAVAAAPDERHGAVEDIELRALRVEEHQLVLERRFLDPGVSRVDRARGVDVTQRALAGRAHATTPFRRGSSGGPALARTRESM